MKINGKNALANNLKVCLEKASHGSAVYFSLLFIDNSKIYFLHLMIFLEQPQVIINIILNVRKVRKTAIVRPNKILKCMKSDNLIFAARQELTTENS